MFSVRSIRGVLYIKLLHFHVGTFYSLGPKLPKILCHNKFSKNLHKTLSGQTGTTVFNIILDITTELWMTKKIYKCKLEELEQLCK